MKIIEKLNGKYIGFPCTPSRWYSEPIYKKISKITVTCGGGMGGSKWYEYVERVYIGEIKNNLNSFRRIDGKEIILNTDYIVQIENFTLVSAKYLTTNKHITGNNEFLIREVSFLIEDDVEVELVDAFKEDAKRMNKKE